MPRQKNKHVCPVVESWNPDFDRIFRVVAGHVFIGGVEQDPITVENLKSDASVIKTVMLFDLLGNTITNEAARYALEEIKQDDSPESRSSKLAFAQALAMWNKHVWTNISLLSKL